MSIKHNPFLALVFGALLFSCQSGEAADTNKLPERSQISSEYKWRLDHIYPTDEAWQADFDRLKSLVPKIAAFQGQLQTSPDKLSDCLELRDEIGITGGKIFAYARMHRDENTANSQYQAMTSRAEAFFAQLGAATAFIEPEILAISEQTLADFRASNPKLAVYSFYFDNLLRQKQHILSPAEEAILAGVSEVVQAPENIFTMLSRADMKFPEIPDEKGRQIQLSEGRYRAFIMSADRKVRENAFQAMFATYGQYRNTMAGTLSGTVKKNAFFAKTRKYDSSLTAALEPDNVPNAVYTQLIETVHNNLGPLHRYVALKKKALGLQEMHMYDLYVPLIRDVHIEVPYKDTPAMIKQGLAPLGPDYAALLDMALTSGWIDVYENKGKQSGGYSWGVYGAHPFILLNYNNRMEDAMTLAHELGHALHSYQSNSTQPYATHDYTIFSAEVASITNETLLLDYLLKTTTDKKKKLYLINEYLESVRTTVYRQTMFAEFEKTIYEVAESGEAITADLLDSIWHDLNVKYFGPSMVVDKAIDAEWSRIPHFYYNFYVYQYVTGFSAANALAQQILTEGEPARARYIDFLKSGGSDYSLTLLKKAGVDMSSPKPIEITLQRFNKMLDELEKLLQE